MRALIGNCLLDGETLLTVTCEAEKIINDRPLTRKCDDPRDFSVLTPNTILLCYLNPYNQPCDVPAMHHPRPNNQWKQAQTLPDTFWKKWTREYLPHTPREAKVAVPQAKFSLRRPRSHQRPGPTERWMAFRISRRNLPRQPRVCSTGRCSRRKSEAFTTWFKERFATLRRPRSFSDIFEENSSLTPDLT